MSEAKFPPLSPIRTGLACRCPRCGKGRLFKGFLDLRPRCEVCGRTLAYRPGQASAVLTQHYNRMHPEALTASPDTTG